MNAAPPRDRRPEIDVQQDFDPNRLVSDVEALGIEWADANGAADLLEETKKSVLAQLMNQYQKSGNAAGGKSPAMNQVEMQAMADDRYRAHLETMTRARTQANRLRVRYDSGRVRLELIRSLQATKREELRQSGMRS